MSLTNAQTYWQNQPASIYGMMLNPEAEELHHQETQQIIDCLPNLSDRKILELGAGIGRFTTYFASQANLVVATDFNPNFIKANQEENSNLSNIIYQCENSINLDFEENYFDFVFINWLLMYLDNEEVKLIIDRIARWLKPQGQFFLRESCITDSKGNPPQASTSTDDRHSHCYSHYRNPEFYIDLYLWNLSGLAEYFFRIYIQEDFQAMYQKARIKYIDITQKFIKKISQIDGIKSYPSQANFVLIELLDGSNAFDFCNKLLISKGIYTRNCSDKIGLQGEFIRIASRTKKENKKIINSTIELLLDSQKTSQNETNNYLPRVL